MQHLTSLTQHLIQLNFMDANDIYSWAENVRLTPVNKHVTTGGIVLGKMQYDAVFSLEGYPHKAHSAQWLFAQIIVWLNNNPDDSDEIIEPELDVDVTELSADIEIKITFEVDITAQQDDEGDITIGQQQYKLDDIDIDFAESGEVIPNE